MKQLINILLILFFVNLTHQIQFNPIEIEYSFKTKNTKEIEPYFSTVKTQLSSFISVSPFPRNDIINIDTKICRKLFKSYKIPLSIDFKIEIIEPSKNDYENDEELKYEICQIERRKRPISGYIIWNNKLLDNNINKKEIEKKIIHVIFHLLGFHEDILYLKKISNNHSKEIPFFQNIYFRNTFLKYYDIFDQDISIKYDDDYLSHWKDLPFDIMCYNNTKVDFDINENTISVLESLEWYSFSKCDISFFQNKCYHISQKCIYENEMDNFLFYTFDDNNKIICYYNDVNNIKNKQCGNKYGNKLNFNELDISYNTNIIPDIKNIFDKRDYIKRYGQTVTLLKPSKKCPNKHPRTLFFYYHPKELGDQIEYNKTLFSKYEFEKITITNPKYYITKSTFKNILEFIESYFILARNNITESGNLISNENLICEPNSTLFHRSYNLFHNKIQKICHTPYVTIEFKKHTGYLKYKKLHDLYPEEYNFYPETYIIKNKKNVPKKFLNYKINFNDLWLVKPLNGTAGIGIEIYLGPESLKDKIALVRYISNPFLINKKKIDLRIYVLITGVKPLRVYISKAGGVHLNIKDYELNMDTLKDPFMHITNPFVQKLNSSFVSGKNYDDQIGNDWTLKGLENYFKDNNLNYEFLWERIKDMVVKQSIAYQESTIKHINELKLDDKNFYQIFGYDVLFDQNFKVWIMETNSFPDLRAQNLRKRILKGAVAIDALNIVGLSIGTHGINGEYYDDVYKYNNIIEENVDNALCELERPRGVYELAFPLKDNIHKYKKFFLNKVEENELFWKKILES